LNIAYLLNTYPLTSTTFIRREIEALENAGLSIQRFAVRAWTGRLVDPRDVAEQRRTRYLLTGNVGGLFVAVLHELLFNTRRFWRSILILGQLLRNSNGGFIRHVAYLTEAACFHQLARARCIDHVHVHFSTNATTVAMLSHVMGGPSFSFTAHGPDEFVEANRHSLDIKIERAAFVVAISTFCRKELLRYASSDARKKIRIIRCGLPIEQFELSHRHLDSQTLVCVGRLCPQKGQTLIPNAVAALRQEFPKLKVILVGEGESRKEIENSIAALNVGDLMELRGWVANTGVVELISQARALLLPSHAEGLPIVIMEAMALGRPVITTRIAAIPELVDESCGWLFEAGDGNGLISAIRAVLNCSQCDMARRADLCRVRVERLHDVRTLARSLFGCFREARHDKRKG
jgi:glycosyltransferase involved in cell wall biosynthesis